MQYPQNHLFRTGRLFLLFGKEQALRTQHTVRIMFLLYKSLFRFPVTDIAFDNHYSP